MEDVDTSLKPRIGLARHTARELLKKANIRSYPIFLKEIAKQVPGLYIDGQEMEDGISGLQVTYDGDPSILYNVKHSLKRNRFTVAHELGHLFLGHTNSNGSMNFQSRDPQEVEANQFAAELLIPLQMLKEAVYKYNTVSGLAKAFWVSKDAMGWRVLETKTYTLLSSWD